MSNLDPMMQYEDREEDQYDRLRIRVPIETHYSPRHVWPLVAFCATFWGLLGGGIYLLWRFWP